MHAIKKIACVLCILWAGVNSVALAQVVPPTGSTPTLGPSDQKVGSVLVFPLVASNASKTADTRITISNISSKKSATINLYFIPDNCLELNIPGIFLTPNQSITFAASDLYPVDRGYLIIVAFDPNTSCPIQNNVLMGSAYVKLPSGYLGTGGAVNDGYNAEAFWAYQTPVCSIAGTTSLLNFDGVTYDKVPSSFVAQIQQPALSPGQTIITAGLNGSVETGVIIGAATSGTSLVRDAGKSGPRLLSISSLLTGKCFGQNNLDLHPNIIQINNTLSGSGYGTLEFNTMGGVGLLITPSGGKWTGIQPLHTVGLKDVTLEIPRV